jgi:hypothetical protein
MGLGLIVQASHAATIMAPEEFQGQLASQIWFRGAGLVALLAFSRIGPSGVRPFLPALCVGMAVLLALVWAPGVRGGGQRLAPLAEPGPVQLPAFRARAHRRRAVGRRPLRAHGARGHRRAPPA